jgi:hypothetical protein
MKTFNGIEIILPKKLTPEVNQVWRSTTSDRLFKIFDITVDKQVWCEAENGDRWAYGFGWFDGFSHIFEGYLKTE